jgi:ABC-type branched-subunit amino acid transport system substrate-binding protein
LQRSSTASGPTSAGTTTKQVGIDGQPIELTIKDDGHHACLAKTDVDTVIFDDEVDLLAGVAGTPNDLAIRDAANAMCIPQLALISGAPEWAISRSIRSPPARTFRPRSRPGSSGTM